MSAEFDKEAKQEYLDAIRFYGKAAERFSEALAACIQKIQESPTRFRQIAPNIRTCRVEKFPYQLPFTLKEDRVYIIAMLEHRSSKKKKIVYKGALSLKVDLPADDLITCDGV